MCNIRYFTPLTRCGGGGVWAQVTEHVGASDRKRVGASDLERVGASDGATRASRLASGGRDLRFHKSPRINQALMGPALGVTYKASIFYARLLSQTATQLRMKVFLSDGLRLPSLIAQLLALPLLWGGHPSVSRDAASTSSCGLARDLEPNRKVNQSAGILSCARYFFNR